ncbi:MAG: hypothetical protein J0H11_10725 [Rhizobiales bacterium]|nr:hypothetical protein [Hyphomicrobiales bacterium]
MLPAAPVHAASFPCSKASHPDEIAVCKNLVLNDDDVEMATLYQTLLPLLAMGGAGATRDAQKAFLAQRQACSSDVACISAAYDARIGALKAEFARIAANGPY